MSSGSGPIGGNHFSLLLETSGFSARPRRTSHCGFYGVYGVAASGVQRWRATIHFDGKSHHIGTFGTKDEAALAYDRAARRHGGRRNLNYVSIETAEAAAAAAAKAERPLVQGT
jgi:hypothetical protein